MKQLRKKLMSFMLALCLILSFPLFSSYALTTPLNLGVIEAQAASKVRINKKKLVLIKGQTYKLKVKGTKKKAKWKSSKKSVVTVNRKGRITARKKGSAVVSAKVGGKTYKCRVTVETPSISRTNLNVTIFSTANLYINGTSQDVYWYSDDNSIATVSNDGTVSACNLGKTKVYGVVGGSRTYSCWVNVVDTKKGQTYTRLKNIINQYGEYDSEGDKYIELYYVDDNGNKFYFDIYVLNNELLFVKHYYPNGLVGGYSYTHVSLDKYSDTAYVRHEINLSDEYPDTIITRSQFNSKVWDNNNVAFAVVSNPYDVDRTVLQEQSNASLFSIMDGSNALLKQYGISINDLGFTAYTGFY